MREHKRPHARTGCIRMCQDSARHRVVASVSLRQRAHLVPVGLEQAALSGQGRGFIHVSPYASLAPPLVTQAVRAQRGEAILPRPDGFVRDGEALCQQHLGQITPAEFVPQAPEHHAQRDVRGRLHVADGRARPLVVGAPAGRGDRGTRDSPTPSPAPPPVSRPPGQTDSSSIVPPQHTAIKGNGYSTRRLLSSSSPEF